MPNLTGQSLGRYHILEQLGEGGMAIVYKAYDTRLETDVAVKIIRTEKFTPEALARTLQRFESEAKDMARLTHPNIVKVTDYGEYEGQPYLVMPYLPGGNLKRYLLEHGRLSWQEAVKILIPIAQALGFAHRQGVIHRDVKPANILLTQDGQPMLTDFGVAKVVEEEATIDLTGSGAGVGTPEYMAPEQAGKNFDHRVDIYALGIVFYEMLTGRRPYEADTPLAVLLKQVSDPLPLPRQFVLDLPKPVEKVIIKALAKKPEDRYQSMNEFTIALEGFSPISTATSEKGTINPLKKRWIPIITLVAFLGIVVLGGVLLKMCPQGKCLLNRAIVSTKETLVTPTVASMGFKSELRIVFLGYPQQGIPKSGTATINEAGLSNVKNADFTRNGGELSPDGVLIAFDNCINQDRGIYLANADGIDPHLEIQITSANYCLENIRWSQDSSRLSYSSPQDGSLHVFDISLKKDIIIPNTLGADWHWWSPGGNEIVYGLAGQTSGIGRLLYITDLMGNKRQLTFAKDFQPCGRDNNTIDVWDPAWSPNGNTIAFTQCESLFVISPDGMNLRQLTTSPYMSRPSPNIPATSAYSPRWSPDGQWIVFIGDNNTLERISADGTTIVNIGQLPYGGGPFSIAPVLQLQQTTAGRATETLVSTLVATSTTNLPGWKKFEADKIELWLPESFNGGDLSKDLDVIVGRLKSMGPDYEKQVQSIEQNKSMFLIWAFDSNVGPSGALTSVAVLHEQILSAVTIDIYMDAGIKQFPSQYKLVDREIVSLERYRAGKLVFNVEGNGIEAREVEFIIKEGDTMWVIVYATGKSEFDQRLPVFEQSVNTFFVNP